MNREFSKKYANITKSDLELFKSFCVECERKRKRPTTHGTVVRPILTKDYCSRGQVDLVDMQSMQHGEYRFIMVYQDHLTKFCFAPFNLQTRSGSCFPAHGYFSNFGAPAILQSDNELKTVARLKNCTCKASLPPKSGVRQTC